MFWDSFNLSLCLMATVSGSPDQWGQAQTSPIANSNRAGALEATGNGSSDAILKEVTNDSATRGQIKP